MLVLRDAVFVVIPLEINAPEARAILTWLLQNSFMPSLRVWNEQTAPLIIQDPRQNFCPSAATATLGELQENYQEKHLR